MNAPAFKEWQVITEALGSGEQTVILRKGGIAEGRGGFEVEAQRFWLFPTHFHAQLEKTKQAAAHWFQPPPGEQKSVSLRYFADLVHNRFITDWDEVARLDPFHFWTPATIRERFDWSKPPGIHLLVLRVHRLSKPIDIELTAEMGGCKSWTQVPAVFEAQHHSPVIDDERFASFLKSFGLLP